MRHHNFMAPWTGRARNYSEAPNTGAVPQITMPFGTTVVPRACLGVIEAGPDVTGNHNALNAHIAYTYYSGGANSGNPDMAPPSPPTADNQTQKWTCQLLIKLCACVYYRGPASSGAQQVSKYSKT